MLIFIFSISLFFLLGVFDLKGGVLILLVSALATYYIAKYYASPQMPWIVFFMVMGQLSVTHLKRQLGLIPWDQVDISGPQMVSI